MLSSIPYSLFFFFNDTATTEIYTLSLHDALPIYAHHRVVERCVEVDVHLKPLAAVDRKSIRLNSSHGYISYAVFCLKKKKRSCRRHSARAEPASCRCRKWARTRASRRNRARLSRC